MKDVGLFCYVGQVDHNILIVSVCKEIAAEPTRRGISCVPTSIFPTWVVPIVDIVATDNGQTCGNLLLL